MLKVPMEDEGHEYEIMQKLFIKRIIVTTFIIMLTSLCVNAQTFIVTDISIFDDATEDVIQKARKTFLGAEVELLFYDRDVRMTITYIEGEKQPMLLKKIDDNLYRNDERNKIGDVIDLELNTIFSYIRSGKIVVYEKVRNNTSIDWRGTFFLKRK